MVDIDFEKFTLKQSFFDRKSYLHGINHTYRVMYHTLLISSKERLDSWALPAFCAAFIHDMSRKDDGYCTKHGSWSAKYKLPLFKDLFVESGLTVKQLGIVAKAVANHSVSEELSKDDDAYYVTSILKDADALDRIRISEDNLNEDFLRFKASKKLVPFAKQLYYETDGNELESFKQVINIAAQITTFAK